MNAHSQITKMTPTERLYSRRVDELALASAALLGLVRVRGPVHHDHQAVVMGHLNDLFGFTDPEFDRASDTLFEATLNHAIHDDDRPRIEKCAMALAEIARTYRGDDKPIWAAGFELFEIDRLWEASLPAESAPHCDPVFENTSASIHYFDRI